MEEVMKKKLCYPKTIFKTVDGVVTTMVVNDAYRHAEMCKEGWSGPPEWGSALPDLRKQIDETERNLGLMKERLAFMEQFEKEREEGGEPKGEMPELPDGTGAPLDKETAPAPTPEPEVAEEEKPRTPQPKKGIFKR